MEKEKKSWGREDFLVYKCGRLAREWGRRRYFLCFFLDYLSSACWANNSGRKRFD